MGTIGGGWGGGLLGAMRGSSGGGLLGTMREGWGGGLLGSNFPLESTEDQFCTTLKCMCVCSGRLGERRDEERREK